MSSGTEWTLGRSAIDFGRPAREVRVLGIAEHWFYLLLGLVLAPFLAATPFLGLVGWFFEALVHEMGHTAASWLVGVPAVPALGLTAEAATMHGEQMLPLTLLIWGAMVYGAFQLRVDVARYLALGLLATLYPLLCFSGLREAWHLASGHLGELIVGAVFLARALSGGFSQNAVERGLYSMLAWFLLGRNFLLGAGLATSAATRSEYALSGSFGLANDLVRLAQHSAVSVEAWGAGLALCSLGVVAAQGIRWIRCQARSRTNLSLARSSRLS